MYRSILNIIGSKYTIFLAVFTFIVFWASTFNPAKASESYDSTAEEAAKWLQNHAEQHDACETLEPEWEKHKQVIQLFNCTLHGETREIIDCSPLE